VWAERRICEC